MPQAVLTSDQVTLVGPQIRELTADLAARSRMAGVGSGDRVLVVGPATPLSLVACWACRSLGAICVPLPARPSAVDLLAAVRAGRPAAVCTPPGAAGTVGALATERGDRVPVVPLVPPTLVATDQELAEELAGRDDQTVCAGDGEELPQLAEACRAVLDGGGWVHCLALADLLDGLARRGAAALLTDARRLRLLRRDIEAELQAAPLVTFAVFEALGADPGPTAQQRREWLAPVHDRLGARLRWVRHVGQIDEETVAFYAGLGLTVEAAQPGGPSGPPRR